MPFATLCKLLGRCALLTGCPHFGLLVGQRCNASNLGPVGVLARNAPDVHGALQALSQHFQNHNPNVALSLTGCCRR